MVRRFQSLLNRCHLLLRELSRLQGMRMSLGYDVGQLNVDTVNTGLFLHMFLVMGYHRVVRQVRRVSLFVPDDAERYTVYLGV